MKILVTGGAGYIGSHICVQLLEAGHEVAIIDNFSNSEPETIVKIEKITHMKVIIYRGDVQNERLLEDIFRNEKIDAVIHLAAFKAVGESVARPIDYYRNNIESTLVLCKVMGSFNVKKLVFSSSATVYGSPATVPIREDFATSSTNPYGTSKLMIERILEDLYISDNSWQITILRYFNPVGAHESGLIGENPKGVPNNLMPFIVDVASGRQKCLKVFGNDYDTPDGTGIRDYIHVEDLAAGHIKAISQLKSEVQIFNLGTGKGCSVLEMVHFFEKATGVRVPYKVVERRPGDIAVCYADCQKARRKLKWQAKKNIEQMCRDAWHFACIQEEEKSEAF